MNEPIVTSAATTNPPLILSVWMEASAQRYFNELRKQYFPPERNFIDAHLTFFHALPNSDAVLNDIIDAAGNQHRFSAQVSGVVSLGNGTALKVESPELKSLHLQLQRKWLTLLTVQDKQGLWPHITIQNKVAPESAHSLQLQLSNDFQPFEFEVIGLEVWKYMGGPWELLERVEFNKPDSLL